MIDVDAEAEVPDGEEHGDRVDERHSRPGDAQADQDRMHRIAPEGESIANRRGREKGRRSAGARQVVDDSLQRGRSPRRYATQRTLCSVTQTALLRSDSERPNTNELQS